MGFYACVKIEDREMLPGGGGVLPYMGYLGMCGPKAKG